MARSIQLLLLVVTLAGFGHQPSGAHQDGLEPPAVADIELADRASDIFIGRIEESFCCGIANGGQLASASAVAFDCPGPCVEYSTLHAVSVLEVLLGDLVPGSAVQVEQIGGTMDGDAQYYAGDGPMAVGEVYLFVTTHVAGPDWYHITGPGQGNVLLPDPETRAAETQRWWDMLHNLPCDVSDVLMLDGAVYGRHRLSAEWADLDSDLAGEHIGDVIRSVPDLVPCRDELTEGDATWLPPGTPIHEVSGYAPSFRLAVQMPNATYVLYEVLWNPQATTAGDLFDIRGKVESVADANYSICLEPVLCDHPPTIVPDLDVDRVVDLFLASPVFPELIVRDTNKGTHRGMLVFYLKDGSYTFVRVGGAGTETLNGIRIDSAVDRAIFDARRAAE